MIQTIYIILFGITLIIQIISRFVYLRYKNISSKSNYTGEEISDFLLSKYKKYNIKVQPLTYTTNYEMFDFKNELLMHKESVFYGNSITSVTIAAQRTYLYLIEAKNPIGRIKEAISPTCHVMISLSWICIFLGLITNYDSMTYLGITMLLLILIYTIITIPLELEATRLALKYLKNEIIDEDEEKYVKNVLICNILFYATNYSQIVIDFFYYAFKVVFEKIFKKNK